MLRGPIGAGLGTGFLVSLGPGILRNSEVGGKAVPRSHRRAAAGCGIRTRSGLSGAFDGAGMRRGRFRIDDHRDDEAGCFEQGRAGVRRDRAFAVPSPALDPNRYAPDFRAQPLDSWRELPAATQEPDSPVDLDAALGPMPLDRDNPPVPPIER